MNIFIYKAFSFVHDFSLGWFLEVGYLYSRMSGFFIQMTKFIILIYTPNNKERGCTFYCKHLMSLLKTNKTKNLCQFDRHWSLILICISLLQRHYFSALSVNYLFVFCECVCACGCMCYQFIFFTHSSTGLLIFFLSIAGILVSSVYNFLK